MRDRLDKLLAEYVKSGDARDIYAVFEDALRAEPPVEIKAEQSGGAIESETHQPDTFPLSSSPSNDTAHKGLGTLPANRANTSTKHEMIGPYHCQSLLGKGGMGAVWRVKDPQLQRMMALKMIHASFAEDAEVQRDFEVEAQISAQLQHPGIVPIYAFDELPNGSRYFTMKEVEGRTLKEVIQSVHLASLDGTWRAAADGWNMRRLINVFHAVCEAMAYAHSKGVLHRDLKPSNIMIGDYGEVLVVDWGIAKVISQEEGPGPDPMNVQTTRSMHGGHSEQGLIIGTPAYMSPEQAWGENADLDARSDVYTLGVILYEILVGQIPYKGSINDILDSKRRGVKPLNSSSARESVQDAGDPFSEQNKDVLVTQHSALLFENIQNTEKRDLVSNDSTTKDISNLIIEDHVVKFRKVPNELAEICEQAMQHDRSDRFQSVAELAASIQSWLDGAQRREKALGIIEQSEAIEIKRKGLIAESVSLWSDAERRISSNGVNCPEGWEMWHTSRQLIVQADELAQEVQQLLQGAMIYDPELADTHRRLVHIEYNAFLDAILRADHPRRDKVARRIQIHLESLPKKEAQYWRRKKERDLGVVNLLRKRRGTFVGRLAQNRQLEAMLTERRLVTLVGTPGVGKTHLALEALARWRDDTEGTAIFCDMSMAKDGLGIAQVLCNALNLTLQSKEPWPQIEMALQSRRPLLLAMDNIEQVVGDAAVFIDRVLQNTDGLVILTTSRIRLGLDEEAVLKLQPMSLLEGIELFTQKAQKIMADFALTENNRAKVALIVSQLDQLPLAIELAAARISMLSVDQIAQRLGRRFDLLRGRLRDPQQQALLGALDWSWDLLSEFGQSTLVQCSAFRNGFDLKAAEAVIDLSAFKDPPQVIDILEALYDDNLLLKERQANGRFRYGLLASIHEYATQKNNSSVSSLAHRHARYFGRLYTHSLVGTPADRSELLSIELDNFIVGVSHGDASDAFLCCQAAMTHFRLKGPIVGGIELSAAYLNRTGLSDSIRMPIKMERIACLRIAGQLKQARAEIQQSLRDD